MTTEALRVLVTGSRDASGTDAVLVRRVLDRTCSDALLHGQPVVIVEGECPDGGVDLIARRWAETTPGAQPEGHPADWDRYGRSAGPIRNAHMASLGAKLCLAFPRKGGSRGTWDCIRKAADAGIPVRIYPL